MYHRVMTIYRLLILFSCRSERSYKAIIIIVLQHTETSGFFLRRIKRGISASETPGIDTDPEGIFVRMCDLRVCARVNFTTINHVDPHHCRVS